MADEYPEEMSTEAIKVYYPDLKASVILVAVGERIYKRDGERWYLLGNGRTEDD